MNSDQFINYRNKISYYSNSSRVYFDSTSFTLVTDLVLDAVKSYYTIGGSRPYTGLYPGTSLASVTIDQCRRSLKEFFSVSDGEIIFSLTRGIALLQVLYTLSLSHEIDLYPYTGLDHEIWLPTFEFANQKGLNIFPLAVQNTLDKLEQEITSKLVNKKKILPVLIIPWISIGNGLTLNQDFLAKIKRQTNCFIILDVSFAVGVSNVKLSDLSADSAIFDSNIGLGGPIGTGILYIRDKFISDMRPYLFLGNGSISKVSSQSYTLEDMPQRLESSINPSIFAGLSKAIEILKELSIESIANQITSLKEYFFELLQHYPDIRLLGSTDKEGYHNILGFVIPDLNMHELAMFLDEIHSIDIRSGSFCAHQLIEQLYSQLNLNNSNLGILQISLHYYTTKEDIKRLFQGINEFLTLLK